MNLNREIEAWLEREGTDFVCFVDISDLPEKQNRGYSRAVLFGVKSTPDYIRHVAADPEYVQRAVADGSIENDEHYLQETGMYRISDMLSAYLKERDYGVYSLSDDNQIADNTFDADSMRTYLPIKTIAVKAGLGWIGKNVLLVTPERGCGQHLGAVLTDAPLEVITGAVMMSGCGNCHKCTDVCKPGALNGRKWTPLTDRDHILDIRKCTTCLQCFVHCPWTQRYINKLT